MRFFHAALLLAVMTSPALAQREPEIVVPGRADVPVIINGVDASWSVVEGEFGLDRPGAMAPVIVFRPFAAAPPPSAVPEGYFPRDGKKPGYGRLEINPPPDAPKPPPAPTFYRSWSSQSGSGPVTDYAPYPMPPVVVEPGFGPNRRRFGPGAGRPPVRGP
jgi:hypothetical protein